LQQSIRLHFRALSLSLLIRTGQHFSEVLWWLTTAWSGGASRERVWEVPGFPGGKLRHLSAVRLW
jgi:hypothetical protein